MFSPELKKEISEYVQQLLAETNHPELPEGEIKFLLHVDGKESWSWANIRNNNDRNILAPQDLCRNKSNNYTEIRAINKLWE